MSSVNGVILSKRASELRQSEGAFSVVAPPSFPTDPLLSTVHELPTSSSSSSDTIANNIARRPRAGTLPSTFHIGTTSATTPSRHLSNGSVGSGGRGFSIAPGTNSTSSLPTTGPNTPGLGNSNGLDFPFSSSNSTTTNTGTSVNSLLNNNNNSSAASRLRSGSLGLPPSSTSLSNAFGPTVWSGGWGNSTPSTSTNLAVSTTLGNEIRSPESSTYGDDSHLRTLDYLGLDNDNNSSAGANSNNSFGIFGDVNGGSTTLEGHNMNGTGGRKVSSPNPIMHNSSSYTNLRSLSISEMAQQGGNASRMRSNTVATYNLSSNNNSNRLSFPPSSNSTSPLLDTTSTSPFHRSTSSTDSSRLLYSSAVGTSPLLEGIESDSLLLRSNSIPGTSINRARAATTIGILDESSLNLSGNGGSRDGYLRRRAGTTATGASIGGGSNGVVRGEGYEGGSTSLLERRLRGMSIGQDESPTTWNSTPRSITPDKPLQQQQHSQSTTPLSQSQSQLPTRSLWIGNLDPATTSSELYAVFAPYGQIENLRLIPDKECAFVNFFNATDAMHAKEDVLSRLGGGGTMNSSTSNSTVRIGYGKPDSSQLPNPSLSTPFMNYSPDFNPNQQFNNQSGIPPGGMGGMPGGMMIGMGMMSSSAPTRALWIGSIPNSTTPAHLVMLFSPFGQIESARVLTHKSCGFINFERVEDAILARNSLSGREILGAEIGTIRIGFAKVPNKIYPQQPFGENLPSLPQNGNGIGIGFNPMNRPFIPVGSGPSSVAVDNNAGLYRGPPPFPQQQNTIPFSSSINTMIGVGGVEMVAQFDPNADQEVSLPVISTVLGTEEEILEAMGELGGEEFSKEEMSGLVPRTDLLYYDTFPPAGYNDPALSRRYANADAPRLRDLRKQLDGLLSTEEIDQIAHELADECVALASDYIGNTLIQKLFERASAQGRMVMLVQIAPHLAQIGIHKNGTWAVQKIIQTIQTPEEHDLVTKSLQPFTPALLLNDFGNYVVQGALRFGSPLTDFIFDAMVDRCWEIGSGRFGARSTRQTLESPLASRYQIKRVAVAILLNSVPLATSPNGALLVTWLLDTSNLPGRYRALATRYVPHLAQLCTHKLASLAVLKIINQRFDSKASRMILDQLSAGEEDSSLIDEILADQVHGTTFLTKVLNSAFVDLKERAIITEKIRAAIGILRAQTIPAYRSIVESVGMPYQGVIISPIPNTPLQQVSYNNNSQQHGLYQNQNSGPIPPQWQQQQQQQQFSPYPLPPPQFNNQMGNFAPYPNNNQSQFSNNYPSFLPGQPFHPGSNNFQRGGMNNLNGNGNGTGFNSHQHQQQQQLPMLQQPQQYQQTQNFMQCPPLDPIQNHSAAAGNYSNKVANGFAGTGVSGGIEGGDDLQDFPKLPSSMNDSTTTPSS